MFDIYWIIATNIKNDIATQNVASIFIYFLYPFISSSIAALRLLLFKLSPKISLINFQTLKLPMLLVLEVEVVLMLQNMLDLNLKKIKL